MSLLLMVWWMSLGLSCLALIMMVAIIMRKIGILRAQRWWAARKDVVTKRVLAYLDNPDQEVVNELAQDSRDVRLVNEVAFELSGSVRGETQARLMNLLEKVGGRQAVIAQLSSKHAYRRLQAVQNLGLLPVGDAQEALLAALEDASHQVRLAAARGLVAKGVEISVDDLIARLDIGGQVQPRSLRDLFRKLAPRSVAQLKKVVSSDFPEAVHLLALDALGASGDFSVISAIAHLAHAKSLNVRAEAMRAFAAIGHPDALPMVIEGLSDPSWEVRSQAAICAGRVGLTEAIGPLAGLLEDAEWWVRYRAARALKEIGQLGVEVLMEFSQGRSDAAQAAHLVLFEESDR